MTHTDKFRDRVKRALEMGVKASHIAKRSGLAPTTVSYALNSGKDVNYETAMRILVAAKAALRHIKSKQR